MTVDARRAAQVRAGVRLEVFTVAWMVMEAVVSIGSGIIAGSILLTAFGIDSLIELLSGGILLWRLYVEAREGDTEGVEGAERKASWVVALGLGLLCVYVLVTAILGLAQAIRPDNSPVGIGVSLAAVIVMPWLSWRKRRLARRIDSGALRGDAASSLTCGYMAATVLVGLVLNAVLGWWWAEYIAALVFLFWLVQETREAFEETREEDEEE